MDYSLKTADTLKTDDKFALRVTDISYQIAQVTSVVERDEFEVAVNYRYEVYDKTYDGKTVLVKKHLVMVV